MVFEHKNEEVKWDAVHVLPPTQQPELPPDAAAMELVAPEDAIN